MFITLFCVWKCQRDKLRRERNLNGMQPRFTAQKGKMSMTITSLSLALCLSSSWLLCHIVTQKKTWRESGKEQSMRKKWIPLDMIKERNSLNTSVMVYLDSTALRCYATGRSCFAVGKPMTYHSFLSPVRESHLHAGVRSECVLLLLQAFINYHPCHFITFISCSSHSSAISQVTVGVTITYLAVISY